jgi:hypothetical protein
MAKQTLKIKLSQLDAITKLHEAVKGLDKDIVRLNDLAKVMIDKDCNIKFTMHVIDVGKTRQDKMFIDEDGDIHLESKIDFQRQQLARYFGIPMDQIQVVGQQRKQSDRMKLSEVVNEPIGLSIIGVILEYKQRERKLLLNQLKDMGIEI